MDRNGKLPTKATLLAPMLLDVLLNMVESHTAAASLADAQRKKQEQEAQLQQPSDSSTALGLASQGTPVAPGSASGNVVAPLVLPFSVANLTATAAMAESMSSADDNSPHILSPPSVSAETGNESAPHFSASMSYVAPQSTPAAQPQSTPLVNSQSTTSTTSLFSQLGQPPSAAGSVKEVALSASATRALQMGVTESDLLFVYRLFRHLIDSALGQRDCIELVSSDVLRKLIPPLKLLAPKDHSLALYTCTLLSNLCGFPESRVVLSSASRDLFGLALSIASHFVLERRATHLALMTISNLLLCDAVEPTEEQCASIVHLIMPQYAENQVVEAWFCVLCNTTAAHPELIKDLIALNVPDIVGRLLLFFGDDARVVARGLQCLSNLAVPLPAVVHSPETPV